jgi:hypothetical protein
LTLIAPRAGGVLSYACDANAWLTEPTGAAFAASVKALFTDAPQRLAKQAEGRAAAQRFAWSTVIPTWFALYEELHQGFPASRFARPAPATLPWKASEESSTP